MELNKLLSGGEKPILYYLFGRQPLHSGSNSEAAAMKGRTPGPKGQRRRNSSAATAAAVLEGGSPAGSLSFHLESVSLFPSSESTPGFEKLIEAADPPSVLDEEDKDCILSQEFFCTPDYITPEGPQIPNNFDFNKENIPCPKSPEKSINGRSKRHRQEVSPCHSLSIYLPCHQQDIDLQMDACATDEVAESKPKTNGSQKKQNYVSQSAVALRCRVMPPPCIKNPYLTASIDLDIFGNRRSKCTVFTPSIGGDGLSRYRTDFHELEQIGFGNFSRVFKVLKRIDGCMYAVKQSIKHLRHDVERMRALMEVQSLAALGSHENIVGYYNSWFENEQLYIQMELCDHSLSVKGANTPRGGEILEVLYHISKALQFMHDRGIAHMDVKPENIYVKNSVYKLGDFGCATLIDRSLHIEEGDSRYMPQEILNDKFEHLDKVDIYSLGVATYELVRGSPLPDSGPQICNLREGKISLLPGYSMQFQSLLKAMMDPNPVKRPSAKEIMEHPIFERARRASTNC